MTPSEHLIAKGEAVGFARGEAIGFAKGQHLKAKEFARRLFAEGFNPTTIARLLKLSFDEVTELLV